jgi:hypothetical protein
MWPPKTREFSICVDIFHLKKLTRGTLFIVLDFVLTLSLAAIKKCIEWRLQVQIAFSTEVDLAPSRPE